MDLNLENFGPSESPEDSYSLRLHISYSAEPQHGGMLYNSELFLILQCFIFNS